MKEFNIFKRYSLISIIFILFQVILLVSCSYKTEDLLLAAEKGNVPAIRRILSSGINPDATVNDGPTALRLAATWGHVEAVKVLLKAGADPLVKYTPPAQGKRVISFSTSEGRKDIPPSEGTGARITTNVIVATKAVKVMFQYIKEEQVTFMLRRIDGTTIDIRNSGVTEASIDTIFSLLEQATNK